MTSFGMWLVYVVVWLLVCLCVLGGILFIGCVSEHVDKTSKGGVAGRTMARYSRENEQWIQKTGLPNLFWIFIVGGVFAVFGFLELFVGSEKAANIVVGTAFYGGIVLLILGAIACIAFAIWFIGHLFSNNDNDNDDQETLDRLERAFKEQYEKEKNEQKETKKQVVKDTALCSSSNQAVDDEDDDWD